VSGSEAKILRFFLPCTLMTDSGTLLISRGYRINLQNDPNLSFYSPKLHPRSSGETEGDRNSPLGTGPFQRKKESKVIEKTELISTSKI